MGQIISTTGYSADFQWMDEKRVLPHVQSGKPAIRTESETTNTKYKISKIRFFGEGEKYVDQIKDREKPV